MSRLRIVAVSVSAVVLMAAVAVLALLRDPHSRMLARRSMLTSVSEGPAAVENGQRLIPVRLRAASGLAVDLLVRRGVADSGRRLPVAVVLGGHLTGRDAARLIGATPGVLLATVSYPYDGDPRPHAAQFIRDIPRIRGAFLDTPPALMLALDYLLRRPDVDSSRVEGIGVSLGAPFVCIAGALDTRFTRIWSIHGSGGSFAPLESNMRSTIRGRPLRIVAAAIANLIIDGPQLDPVRWAPLIAPRPFIMVNAESDERMPRASVAALYQSARQPKEQIWMPGRHVHADVETIERLLAIVMARISIG